MITYTVCSAAGSDRTQLVRTVHFLFVRKIGLDQATIRFRNTQQWGQVAWNKAPGPSI